ncbi:involucrin [Drosophila serrata]|uniref:involucrin n=1 Tax=Drosophila serrata TaxID=7274 RepID=UPI000A1D2C63|nr:involucrin [Drosophila serrata]
MGMSGPLNPKQVASNIALQAAQDAKKASDTQLPAAVAAARQVKLQLADRAGAAAWAAEAALAGKQQMVEQLRAEVRESEIVFQDESASVGASQNNLNAAVFTSTQANDLLQKLQDAVRIAQETVSSADAAVCGAHQEVQEKSKLVDAAQHRVELLAQQLRNAKLDYENTKKAAFRASCAAAEARQKAMRERRSSTQEIRTYRDQQPTTHHQTLVQAPLRKMNFKQMQPEEWEYIQQNKFAAESNQKPLMKRRTSGNNMKAYRQPQQTYHQTQEQTQFQEFEQKHQQIQEQSQFPEVNVKPPQQQWEYNEQGKAMFSS